MNNPVCIEIKYCISSQGSLRTIKVQETQESIKILKGNGSFKCLEQTLKGSR